MAAPSTLFYSDIDTTSLKVGKARFSQPFMGDNGEYLLDQDFQVDIGSFAPLALNTVHPDFATYHLVGESPLQDLGGGQMKWTRTYAQVPALRNDYSSISYNFIGYLGVFPVQIGLTPGSPQLLGRPRFTAVVNCRIQSDYFLVGTGGSYTIASAIPQIYEQKYYVPSGTWQASGITFVFVPLYTDPTLQALYGIPCEYIYDTTGPLALSIAVPSVPTRSQYDAMRIAQTEIVAENSSLSRWRGNIYVRTTKYVVAI